MALGPWHEGVIFFLHWGYNAIAFSTANGGSKGPVDRPRDNLGARAFASSSLYSIQDCSTNDCFEQRLGLCTSSERSIFLGASHQYQRYDVHPETKGNYTNLTVCWIWTDRFAIHVRDRSVSKTSKATGCPLLSRSSSAIVMPRISFINQWPPPAQRAKAGPRHLCQYFFLYGPRPYA